MKPLQYLLTFALVLSCLAGCQRQDAYETIVLKSKVKELETQVEKLQSEIGASAERKRLQTTINRLQDELIEVQQTVSSLKEMRVAPSKESTIDLGNMLPAPPTEEEIAAAVEALTAGGADVEKDAEGKVIYVKATEFPLDDETVAQLEKIPATKTAFGVWPMGHSKNVRHVWQVKNARTIGLRSNDRQHRSNAKVSRPSQTEILATVSHRH